MIELTKGQKKVVRMLINKALFRECEKFLLQTLMSLRNQGENAFFFIIGVECIYWHSKYKQGRIEFICSL